MWPNPQFPYWKTSFLFLIITFERYLLTGYLELTVSNFFLFSSVCILCSSLVPPPCRDIIFHKDIFVQSWAKQGKLQDKNCVFPQINNSW